jgi:hypothetical protein
MTFAAQKRKMPKRRFSPHSKSRPKDQCIGDIEIKRADEPAALPFRLHQPATGEGDFGNVNARIDSYL